MTLGIVKIISCMTSKQPIITKKCLVIIELVGDKFLLLIVKKKQNDCFQRVVALIYLLLLVIIIQCIV